MAWWHHIWRGSWNWVNIGSGNDLVPSGTKSLPEQMLTNHQWVLLAFTWGKFHRKCSRYPCLIIVWKLLIYEHSCTGPGANQLSTVVKYVQHDPQPNKYPKFIDHKQYGVHFHMLVSSGVINPQLLTFNTWQNKFIFHMWVCCISPDIINNQFNTPQMLLFRSSLYFTYQWHCTRLR